MAQWLLGLDSRLLAFAVWGLGTVAIYGYVLWRRRHSYLVHHDARSRRDVVEALGLFLVALSAAASIWIVLFVTPGSGVRIFLTTVSLGAFLGVGLVMATESFSRDPDDPDATD